MVPVMKKASNYFITTIISIFIYMLKSILLCNYTKHNASSSNNTLMYPHNNKHHQWTLMLRCHLWIIGLNYYATDVKTYIYTSNYNKLVGKSQIIQKAKHNYLALLLLAYFKAVTKNYGPPGLVLCVNIQH